MIALRGVSKTVQSGSAPLTILRRHEKLTVNIVPEESQN